MVCPGGAPIYCPGPNHRAQPSPAKGQVGTHSRGPVCPTRRGDFFSRTNLYLKYFCWSLHVCHKVMTHFGQGYLHIFIHKVLLIKQIFILKWDIFYEFMSFYCLIVKLFGIIFLDDHSNFVRYCIWDKLGKSLEHPNPRIWIMIFRIEIYIKDIIHHLFNWKISFFYKYWWYFWTLIAGNWADLFSFQSLLNIHLFLYDYLYSLCLDKLSTSFLNWSFVEQWELIQSQCVLKLHAWDFPNCWIHLHVRISCWFCTLLFY